MRTLMKSLLLCSLAGLLQGPLRGQSQAPMISGKWFTDQRILVHEPYPWSWSENRLDLGLKKSYQDKATLHASIWLRNFGFPFLKSSDQLFNKDETSPYQIDFREAWLDLYGFLLPGLDIRIGRQVIPWGRGDRINPTRVFNPLDLEDIWDFGRVQGVEALKMDYYLGHNYFLEGVYVPFFRPAILPRGDLASFFGTSAPLAGMPPGAVVTAYSDSLILPENRPGSSSSAGIKFGGFLMGFDFSLSYAYVIDGLPLPSRATVSFASPAFDLAVETDLVYPRFHMAGADFAGSVLGLGIWGEGGMFIPARKGILYTDLSLTGMPDTSYTLLEDRAFFRYLLGTDYTFRNGTYLNIQFVHGFFHERGRGELNDYILFECRRKFAGDRISLSPLSGALVVGSWKHFSEDHVLIWSPTLSYFPNDNTELGLGIRVISGKGDNAFAGLRDRDECFFRLSYQF